MEPRAPLVKRQRLFAPAVAPVLPLNKSLAVSVRMINFIIIACINIIRAHRTQATVSYNEP